MTINLVDGKAELEDETITFSSIPADGVCVHEFDPKLSTIETTRLIFKGIEGSGDEFSANLYSLDDDERDEYVYIGDLNEGEIIKFDLDEDAGRVFLIVKPKTTGAVYKYKFEVSDGSDHTFWGNMALLVLSVVWLLAGCICIMTWATVLYFGYCHD